MHEFAEEVGGAASSAPRAVAVVYDDAARSWEVVLLLDVASEAISPTSDEYEELNWCDAEQLPQDLTPIAQRIRKLVFG